MNTASQILASIVNSLVNPSVFETQFVKVGAEQILEQMTALQKASLVHHELMHSMIMMNDQVNEAAQAYSIAIMDGKVSKAAEELRIKWYKLIDQRGELQLKMKELDAAILDCVRGMLA